MTVTKVSDLDLAGIVRNQKWMDVDAISATGQKINSSYGINNVVMHPDLVNGAFLDIPPVPMAVEAAQQNKLVAVFTKEGGQGRFAEWLSFENFVQKYGPESGVNGARISGAADSAIPGSGSLTPLASTHPNMHGYSLRTVNPQGWLDNCGSSAIALDRTLAGNPTSAINSGRLPLSDLADFYGTTWKPYNYIGIERQMIAQGDGARGIVVGQFRNAEGKLDAHYFNVVNQGGKVVYLDGQVGQVVNTTQYKAVSFLPTTP